jgi:hypothetical protein
MSSKYRCLSELDDEAQQLWFELLDQIWEVGAMSFWVSGGSTAELLAEKKEEEWRDLCSPILKLAEEIHADSVKILPLTESTLIEVSGLLDAIGSPGYLDEFIESLKAFMER